MTKPTIALIPGAWHRAAHYAPCTSLLEKAGYTVHGIDYPSTSENPTTANFDPDVAVARETLTALADRGEDIVLVLHSAGGFVGAHAARGFSKADREKEGKPGGIVRLVYLTAFAAAEGLELSSRPISAWQSVEGPALRVPDPKPVFYNCCSPDVADDQAGKLLLFSSGFRNSTIKYAPWKHIPSTYLICENDQAIKLPVQEMFISQEGANFDVVRCAADHSPFLSMPELTAEVVRKAAGEVL